MSGAQERESPEPVTSAGCEAVPACAGVLILVAGPSGSGKDTLISEARRHFHSHAQVVFCERIITRADQTGEAHLALSRDDFTRAESEGGFFLSWDAHGLRYGVPAEIEGALRAGKSVVVNVSRRAVAEARAKWPRTFLIHVTARPDILRARLTARGRETPQAIEERLARGGPLETPEAGWAGEIDNSGALAPAANRFIALIEEAMRGT